MKVIWELSDIKSGRMIKSSDGGNERWRIGFFASYDLSNVKWVIMSQSDGTITYRYTKSELVEFLNSSSMLPDEIFGLGS